jgi:thiol-disulfide isomerase/thioredoxin
VVLPKRDKWRFSHGHGLRSVLSMFQRTTRRALAVGALTVAAGAGHRRRTGAFSARRAAVAAGAVLAASAAVIACQPRVTPKADVAPQAAAVPATEKPADEPHTGEARAALIGRPAPGITLDGIDGERVSLSELVGKKPVYLKFWATWCKPCMKQMPHLEAAHRKYGDRIAVYAIDLGVNDPIEAVRAVQAEQKLTVPIAIDRDGSLAERLHVSVTPQHVLIDRGGIVRYVGHRASAELDAALEALLDEPAPSAPPPRAEPTAGGPLSLPLLDGSTFTLGAHAGQPIALTFVSTWCDDYLATSRPAISQACIAHVRQVEALRRSHGGIFWVTITHPVWTDTAELDSYRARVGHHAPIGLDQQSRWFHHYRVRDVATTILLDGRGAEIARITGRGDELPGAISRLAGATP